QSHSLLLAVIYSFYLILADPTFWLNAQSFTAHLVRYFLRLFHRPLADFYLFRDARLLLDANLLFAHGHTDFLLTGLKLPRLSIHGYSLHHNLFTSHRDLDIAVLGHNLFSNPYFTSRDPLLMYAKHFTHQRDPLPAATRRSSSSTGAASRNIG